MTYVAKSGTIAIFSAPIQGLPHWDPENIKRGISGSEEAVIYMSQELVRLGYAVTVFGMPPPSSPHSSPTSNPRFVSWDFEIGTHCFDIAISCRMPQIGAQLKRVAKQVYLWPQDILTEPSTEGQINAFDDVLWISKWQRNQWVSLSPSYAKFTGIYGNGINPNQFSAIEERKNPHSCIYGSNYSRGLEVLLDLWPEVKNRFPLATLDICYGWQHWGTLAPEKEAKMRSQIPSLMSLGVHHHGLVGHESLNRLYAKASLWTYPCIAPETFCITALRAQFSGSLPVIIDGSALSEVVRYGYRCLRAEQYLNTLTDAMRQAERLPLEKRQEMRDFISQNFTWEVLASRYKHRFDSLLCRSPSPKASERP